MRWVAGEEVAKTAETPLNSSTRRRPTVSSRELSPALTSSIGFLLSKAADLVTSDFELALRPYGLRPRGFGVLSLVDQLGPLPQHRIGEKLRIDRTTMVSLIDSLEEGGFVARTKDPQDRRRYAITLSERGRQLLHGELAEVNQRINSEFLHRLSPAERDSLTAALLKLLQPEADSSPG
jgi:DNA-binding MarR family transcriptional regulator